MAFNEPQQDGNQYTGSGGLSLKYVDSRLVESGHALYHSDTQFDSSTDETVIPYMIGEHTSQDFISAASVDRFDPEASPTSYLSRRTRHSIDTDQCGTLYEETVNVELDPLPVGYQNAMADTNRITSHTEGDESQRLVGGSPNQPVCDTTATKTCCYGVRRGWFVHNT